jgi:hypothetical protein
MLDDSIVGKELYELSPAQATEILHQFLANERESFNNLRIESVELDYSKESIFKLFEYVLASKFNRATPESETNNIWICRIAYYFGETLKRQSNRLAWGIGKRNTAEENHPVIAGFANGTQAALIMISRNLLEAVALDGNPPQRITNAIDAWFEAASS